MLGPLKVSIEAFVAFVVSSQFSQKYSFYCFSIHVYSFFSSSLYSIFLFDLFFVFSFAGTVESHLSGTSI